MSTHPPGYAADRLFAFEADFADRLPCIPMAVRRKLDLAGAKISLAQWTHLPLDTRRALLSDPVADETSAELWKQMLDSALRESGTDPSKSLPIESSPPWSDTATVPSEVAAQTAACGFRISPAQWAGLDELTRFALCKLSRPGHENRNFLAAAREAGLTS